MILRFLPLVSFILLVSLLKRDMAASHSFLNNSYPDVFNMTVFSLQFPNESSFLQQSFKKMLSQSNGNKVIMACCSSYGVYGGFSDRLNGLYTGFLLAVEHNSTFEIHPDYLATKIQHCEKKYPRYMASSTQVDRMHEYQWNSTVLYLATNRGTKFGKLNSHLLGGFLLHMTNAWADEKKRQIWKMKQQIELLLTDPFVVLHVRVGNSKFIAGDHHIVHSNKSLDYNTKHSAQLLVWAKGLHRDLSCSKKLVLISDSEQYVAEFMVTVPEGLKVFRCCTQASHLDKPKTNATVDLTEQTLFDLILISKAKLVFRTIGGFPFASAIFGNSVAIRESFNRTEVNLDALLSGLSCINKNKRR